MTELVVEMVQYALLSVMTHESVRTRGCLYNQVRWTKACLWVFLSTHAETLRNSYIMSDDDYRPPPPSAIFTWVVDYLPSLALSIHHAGCNAISCTECLSVMSIGYECVRTRGDLRNQVRWTKTSL